MFEKPERPIDKKREYFSRLALSVKEALVLHEKAGLWELKDNKRDWGNVSEHCLVATARVNVLSDKLNLSEDIKRDLMIAAALHDFFKKGEKEIVSAEGLTWDSFEKSSAESEKQIKKAGFSERIRHLAGSAGHNSLLETENILNKETLTPEDIAYLVLHYVDDYTIGSDWANQTETTSDVPVINDLDRRMEKNEANSRYAKLNEDGKLYFKGETTFAAQRRIGHLVENKLASLLSEKTGQTINAKELPSLVDQEIKNRVEKL